MDIKEALNRVVNNLDLTTAEMQDVMRLIMTGQCTDAQIGAFLMGMRMKSETIDEIVGAATVMRELASPVSIDAERLVDTCGTGGDGMNVFNVSTAAAFVVVQYPPVRAELFPAECIGAAEVGEAVAPFGFAEPDLATNECG